jgi:2,4-diaminopentanoate dehydrogenase
MSEKKYRVIQWATGTVGSAALKHFIENPVIELVGLYVTNPEKVGKDAGDLVGLPRTGVIASDDIEKFVAMEADCVLYAPAQGPTLLDTLCRLLASGKNVVSPAGPFLPSKWFPEQAERIEAACREGNSSFHGCGVHPGFSGDILPLTLARLMNRIDTIEVTEIIDKVRNPMIYTEMMGFGLDPEFLLANPRRSPETYKAFYSSMDMIAKGLGKEIEKVTVKFEVAKAKRDIEHLYGVVKAGTVGGQHYEWTAWADGRPLIVYHFYWQLGDSNDDLDPLWEEGESCYRVVIKGDPPMEVRLMGAVEEDGRRPFHGLPWTGLVGVTAVPAVCDAAPGVISHFDLGIVQPRGLVRPA